MRDLRQEDLDLYMEFFNALSEESIRCRFGHLLAKLTRSSALPKTTSNDHGRAVAILDEPQTRIVAIGRCYHDAHANESEVALVVSENTRRLGLARHLLRQLVTIAGERNSRSIHAFIATNNAPVIRLLQSEGFVTQPVVSGDDLKLTLCLEGRLTNSSHQS